MYSFFKQFLFILPKSRRNFIKNHISLEKVGEKNGEIVVKKHISLQKVGEKNGEIRAGFFEVQNNFINFYLSKKSFLSKSISSRLV